MPPKRKTSSPEPAPQPQPQPEHPASPARAAGYVVLARRYRPSRFEEVVGQQHVTRTLQNAIAAERLHHAYLFTGSRGVGKTTVARILAKALNCERTNKPTAQPCDDCPACQEIKMGSAVDVQEIDGASHTGVDDVRELRESVRYQPARCRYRIYIIDEVHMLSTSAFNALLKTLEEPPPHVVFMFATTEPHKIPATILSRCQRFDFKRVPDAVLIKHLQSLCEREEVTIDRPGLGLLARASEGSVRDALSLLDQVIAYSAPERSISSERVAEVLGVADRRVLFDLSQALLAREGDRALGVIDRLFEGGQDLAQFAQAFLAHLRDLTVVRTCKEPAGLLEATEAELGELHEQAGMAGAELLPQLFERFARAAEEVARSSFPRLVLEMALVEMVRIEPLLPLGDLLERLERLEQRLGAGGSSPAGGQGRIGGPRFGAPPGGRPGRSSGASARPVESSQASTATKASSHTATAASTTSPAGGNGHGAATGTSAAALASPASAALAGASVGSLAAIDDPAERWRQLLHQLETGRPLVATTFSTGKLLEWTDDRLLLGYRVGDFALQRAQDPEKKRLLEEECQRLIGRKISVQARELTVDEAASPEVARLSALEEAEQRRKEKVRELREEAESHPLTRALVEKFGAEIQAISTETESGGEQGVEGERGGGGPSEARKGGGASRGGSEGEGVRAKRGREGERSEAGT